MGDLIYQKLIIIPAILLAFAFHEYSHAKMADKLGDKTPRFQGRLTLNPAKHVDLFGFIAIVLVGFGWAKPVETNPAMYKNYYKDDLKVSLAGPIANLLLAIVGCFLWVILFKVGYKNGLYSLSFYKVISDICSSIFTLNVGLFIFNLLPVPGLDGFHIIRDLKPDLFYKYRDIIERYQGIILLIFVFGGARIISVPVSYVIRFILNIVTLLVGLN